MATTPGSAATPGGAQPGDTECRTCIGVSLLTAEMRERGQKPTCFGVSGVLKQRIPVDQLEQLNKENTAAPDLGMAIIIGYARSSGLMDRTGRVPVCIKGLQMHIARRVVPKPRAPDQQEQKKQKQQQQDGSGSENSTSAPPSRGTHALPSVSALSAAATVSIPNALEHFQRLVKRGVNKQWTGMKKQWATSKAFISSTAKDFPQKMSKGSSGLFSAMDKTSRTLYQKIASFFSED